MQTSEQGPQSALAEFLFPFSDEVIFRKDSWEIRAYFPEVFRKIRAYFPEVSWKIGAYFPEEVKMAMLQKCPMRQPGQG